MAVRVMSAWVLNPVFRPCIGGSGGSGRSGPAHSWSWWLLLNLKMCQEYKKSCVQSTFSHSGSHRPNHDTPSIMIYMTFVRTTWLFQKKKVIFNFVWICTRVFYKISAKIRPDWSLPSRGPRVPHCLFPTSLAFPTLRQSRVIEKTPSFFTTQFR